MSNKAVSTMALTAAVFFGLTDSVLAEEIIFVVEGTVRSVSPELSEAFSVGDTMTMTYTFESGTLDSSPSVAVGDYIDTITEVSVTVGTYDATGGSENIRVQDDCDGFDRYLVPLSDVLSGVSVNGFDLIAASLRLLDSTGTAFITDDLPTSPPNLADFNDFPSSFFGLGFESDLFPFFAKVSAEVTSIILVTCGNGTFDAGEECDDGNREDDDGCSSDCLVDPGFSCKFEPRLCRKTPLR